MAESVNRGSLRRMAMRLTAQEWHEVADIYEEAGSGAEMQAETNGHRPAEYAAAVLRDMALRATAKALQADRRERHDAQAGARPHSPTRPHLTRAPKIHDPPSQQSASLERGDSKAKPERQT